MDEYLYLLDRVATAAAPAQKPPILTRYGVDFCSACSLMIDYCRCGPPIVDVASSDAKRAEASLAQRIKACQSR